MSQNKTVVPGMENGGQRRNNPHSNYYTDFYARDTQATGISKGTVVPGMQQNADNNRQPSTGGRVSDFMYSRPQSNKPILGFLYSISRQGIGECWPLYLGPNTIGCSPTCNICLREGTVSREHAILMVRKLKNPEKTIASLEDTHSTNGTMLNGNSLSFSQVECKNGDIITIGENYELVVFLIDIKALGLKVAENFIPINEPEMPHPLYDYDDPYVPHSTQTDDEDIPYPPKFGGTHNTYDNNSFQGYTDGTVGMDGSNLKPGGTIGM